MNIGKKLQHKEALTFILAGKAFTTFKNANTDNRFTYKIKRHKDKDIFFVYVLTDADNTDPYSYTFLGTIFRRHDFFRSKKSRVPESDVKIKVFKYVFERLWSETLPWFIEIWHEGRCGRCGRRLTVPESCETGYGPECWEVITGEKAKRSVPEIKTNTHKR